MNDFNATPVSSLMGPARGLILELDVHRLAGVFTEVNNKPLPLCFLDVLAESLLAVDQDDQFPVAFRMIGHF